MNAIAETTSPMRITDLTGAHRTGASVRVSTRFEILPVDFRHRSHPFQAYIFLVCYQGTIDGKPFEFRKCYARGCPNNLCTHVSMAVNIANRYLQRDYQALKSAGIDIEETLFSLDDMVIKFDRLKETDQTALTIPELVDLARSGKKPTLEITLEEMPAVEHFAGLDQAQTFLGGEIIARIENTTYCCHRCFACYPTEKAAEEKKRAVKVANARLELVYQAFGKAGIVHQPKFFQT